MNSGYAPCLMFQVQPNPFGTCDPSRAQSPHSGGMNCGLADGSVRFITQGITPTTWVGADNWRMRGLTSAATRFINPRASSQCAKLLSSSASG